MNWSYLVIPFVVLATAALGSVFTARSLEIWYTTINKPSWTPPGWLIGGAWTIIYILGALSALMVWNAAPRNPTFWGIVAIFILNAILNVLWTYIFFFIHRMKLAFYEAVLLELTVLALVILIYPVNWPAAVLLLPYLLWVAFACVLNQAIVKLNP